VLYYDHILTFDDEVNYIWNRPKRGSAYWFFANRYVTFFANLLVTIAVFIFSDKCTQFAIFQETLLVFNQLVVSILLALRIYALYERSTRMLLCLFGMGASLLGVTIVCIVFYDHVCHILGRCRHFHILFCLLNTTTGLGIAWIALLVYDTMIFCLTVYRTWTTRRYQKTYGIKTPLISLILRDG
ncbi:hypothetical protein BDQ17DRAFT_1263752, partial [Cyathus striatus]